MVVICCGYMRVVAESCGYMRVMAESCGYMRVHIGLVNLIIIKPKRSTTKLNPAGKLWDLIHVKAILTSICL